jgi:hypothetical protein
MILYHFTSGTARVGNGSLETPAPGSILAVGVLPNRTYDYDHALHSPLPPCVWLTADPDMPSVFCGGHRARISLVIPSTDRRLVNWYKYARKHGADTVIDQADIPAAWRRSPAQFWLYFAPVEVRWFRAVESVPAMAAA